MARGGASRVVIGITGPPGGGKSEAASAFGALGARVLSLDAIGHEFLTDPAVKDRLAARFGPGIFAADGSVSRTELGRVVFADADSLGALNAIVHPGIVAQAKTAADDFRAAASESCPALVIEGALLVETGLHRSCDRVVLVTADRAVRLSRVAARRGWTSSELERRESAQMNDRARRAHADAVIVNASTIEDLHSHVENLWREWT
jgi:dephospho-CoA kinase